MMKNKTFTDVGSYGDSSARIIKIIYDYVETEVYYQNVKMKVCYQMPVSNIGCVEIEVVPYPYLVIQYSCKTILDLYDQENFATKFIHCFVM